MLDALETFDPERGSFSTHLNFHVRDHFAAVAGRRGSRQRPELYAASLDELIGEDQDTRRLDTLADPGAEYADDVIERESLRRDCAALMVEIGHLPDRQRQALLLTAWSGLTLEHAAEVIGSASRERVRQLRNQAAKKIRHTSAARRMERDYKHVPIKHTGLKRFKETHTSSVERAILWLEEHGYLTITG